MAGCLRISRSSEGAYIAKHVELSNSSFQYSAGSYHYQLCTSTMTIEHLQLQISLSSLIDHCSLQNSSICDAVPISTSLQCRPRLLEVQLDRATTTTSRRRHTRGESARVPIKSHAATVTIAVHSVSSSEACMSQDFSMCRSFSLQQSNRRRLETY